MSKVRRESRIGEGGGEKDVRGIQRDEMTGLMIMVSEKLWGWEKGASYCILLLDASIEKIILQFLAK